MTQVSVQDTVLVGIPGKPRLIGGKCPDCGNHVFPMQKDCPKCTGDQIEKVELSTKGRTNKVVVFSLSCANNF